MILPDGATPGRRAYHKHFVAGASASGAPDPGILWLHDRATNSRFGLFSQGVWHLRMTTSFGLNGPQRRT
jgi:hypothetical protein